MAKKKTTTRLYRHTPQSAKALENYMIKFNINTHNKALNHCILNCMQLLELNNKQQAQIFQLNAEINESESKLNDLSTALKNILK